MIYHTLHLKKEKYINLKKKREREINIKLKNLIFENILCFIIINYKVENSSYILFSFICVCIKKIMNLQKYIIYKLEHEQYLNKERLFKKLSTIIIRDSILKNCN